MDYSNPKKSGQIAFLKGLGIDENPIDRRTNANARLMWTNGWLKQSNITCDGVELSDGSFTGCTQTDGDCPECGK